MRIGLYGLPCAGKTTLMDTVKDMKVLSGGDILHDMSREIFRKEFGELTADERDFLRRKAASRLMKDDEFIIDGHYAFGTLPVLPDEETICYDVSLYLYTDPEVIRERMLSSEKNRKYAGFDIRSWQLTEIEKIRENCHRLHRDFYVISDGGKMFLPFLREIKEGFSCLRRGDEIGQDISSLVPERNVTISDGDKTLSVKDTEYLFTGEGTKTFDGDFYTGYQTWLHGLERKEFRFDPEAVKLRAGILAPCRRNGAVITSGPEPVWEALGKMHGFRVYTGNDISADTKYFAARRLKENGKLLTACGDGMSDYYMLKQADMGILIRNGRVSRSLTDRDLHGLYIYEREED